MKRTIFKNKQDTRSIRNISLSKISEENIDDNYNSEEPRLENKVNCCHVTFVCDDLKVTSDTSDCSNNPNSDNDKVSPKKESVNNKPSTFVSDDDKSNGDKSYYLYEEESGKGQVSDKKKSRNNKTTENMNQSCLLSRFVPEFIDNNKITIV